MNLDTSELIAIAAALGWASGLRLYAVVFLTGLAGQLGWVDLPAGLRVLEHPAMLSASGFISRSTCDSSLFSRRATPTP